MKKEKKKMHVVYSFYTYKYDQRCVQLPRRIGYSNDVAGPWPPPFRREDIIVSFYAVRKRFPSGKKYIQQLVEMNHSLD